MWRHHVGRDYALWSNAWVEAGETEGVSLRPEPQTASIVDLRTASGTLEYGVQSVDGSPCLALASQSRAQLLRPFHVQLALFNDDPVDRFGIFNRDNIVEDIFVNQGGGAIEGIAVAAG